MSSLPELLRESARRYPHHPAIKAAEGILDFATFDRLSDRVAAALAARGVGHGDRVGLLCPNGVEFALAYAGILKAGAVVTPVNVLLHPDAMAVNLNDAGAKGLIYHTAFASQREDLRGRLADLSFAVAIGENTAAEDPLWAELLECDAPVPQPVFNPQEDLAAILYTSGTTGRAKGAMLTHANLAANTRSVREAMRWRPGEDVALVVLPMFHAFAATVGMLTPLTCGCALAPLARFEPELVARTIAASGATVFLGVPSMYNVLLRLSDASVPFMKGLRLCVSGGAALPGDVQQRFEEKFGLPVHEGDGPTECSPVTCVNPVGGRVKPGTVGLPVAGVEMRILDDEGRELPDGEVGEIAVRGPNVMKGYWKQPEETAQVFRGEWFLTGDLGVRDEDGYFSILDRKKDLVIVNGMNVYPRIVEEVIQRHPAVREVAVVGEADDLHGEIPVAWVSLLDGEAVTAAEIRAFCRERLGRHEVPRQVYFLPELPKNATGKILKRELNKRGEVERGVV
ncbi:MAG TPA: long-chain fatty acid--CoA ligase [Methylococcaceae bacterium]|nr:long-chain fatty acid--CoA ligase [Methylococcaceae bacterium]